jgi:FKBP-type peptidyl-prolyl cis-trans isomerase SlyD
MSYLKRPLATVLATLLLVSPGIVAAAEKTKDDRIVKDGMQISLEYTLKGTDGKVIETTKGQEPVRYIHGQNMMIPGLEKALAGIKVGGQKNIKVKPEDAYGPVDPKAFEEVAIEHIPANAMKVGAILAAPTPDGGILPARVHQIKEKTVVLDLNHPLAGKTLIIEVRILDIQPPPAQPSTAEPPKPAAAGKPAAPAKPAEPAKK